MNSRHMSRHVAFIIKGLLTYVTRELFFTSMSPNMSYQIAPGTKWFGTLGTPIVCLAAGVLETYYQTSWVNGVSPM